MSIIPELFLFLRVRNNFPGNVSFSCTLRGELGIKEGERTGKSILRWEQREPGEQADEAGSAGEHAGLVPGCRRRPESSGPHCRLGIGKVTRLWHGERVGGAWR